MELKNKKLKTISLRISEEMLKELDKIVKEKNVKNRSELITYLISKGIKEFE